METNLNYTVTSTNTEEYDVIRTNLQVPYGNLCQLRANNLTTKASFIVLAKDDYITINNQKFIDKSKQNQNEQNNKENNMQINEYQKLAMTTLNKDLTKKEVLVNSVMGLNGEAGEVIDLVKKHLFHGHELNKEELIKELGDVAWYLAEAAYALDIDLETILELNIEKLKKRYPEGFSTEKSINRV